MSQSVSLFAARLNAVATAIDDPTGESAAALRSAAASLLSLGEASSFPIDFWDSADVVPIRESPGYTAALQKFESERSAAGCDGPEIVNAG